MDESVLAKNQWTCSQQKGNRSHKPVAYAASSGDTIGAEVIVMSESMNQKIGCNVTSCAYNKRGCDCGLSAIQVEPCPQGHSGKAMDESMCANYRSKP